MYIDVGYKPSEVAALCNECIFLRSKVSNVEALDWLKKMISACDLALHRNLGLYLACD